MCYGMTQNMKCFRQNENSIEPLTNVGGFY